MDYSILRPSCGASADRRNSGSNCQQANGSAFVRYGDSVVMSTRHEHTAREGVDFFRWRGLRRKALHRGQDSRRS
jgi:polyribonucleotide nucleotidyltransferase